MIHLGSQGCPELHPGTPLLCHVSVRDTKNVEDAEDGVEGSPQPHTALTPPTPHCTQSVFPILSAHHGTSKLHVPGAAWMAPGRGGLSSHEAMKPASRLTQVLFPLRQPSHQRNLDCFP